jgi:hypothetical protein
MSDATPALDAPGSDEEDDTQVGAGYQLWAAPASDGGSESDSDAAAEPEEEEVQTGAGEAAVPTSEASSASLPSEACGGWRQGTFDFDDTDDFSSLPPEAFIGAEYATAGAGADSGAGADAGSFADFAANFAEPPGGEFAAPAQAASQASAAEPLSAEEVSLIRETMASLEITPPPWVRKMIMMQRINATLAASTSDGGSGSETGGESGSSAPMLPTAGGMIPDGLWEQQMAQRMPTGVRLPSGTLAGSSPLDAPLPMSAGLSGVLAPPRRRVSARQLAAERRRLREEEKKRRAAAAGAPAPPARGTSGGTPPASE